MDRLAKVADMVKRNRGRAKMEEVVAVAKAGMVSGEQAAKFLERLCETEESEWQGREVPCGVMLDEDVAGETPEDRVVREEVTNALLRVINALSGRQGQCVELYYFGGLTQDQIAERLGIGQDVVSRHLAAARGNLASSVGVDPIFSPQDKLIQSEGNFWQSMMALSYAKQHAHQPSLYPYELMARYNAGTRQAANGQWVAVVEDRLGEYIRDAFGSGVCKPWKY